MSSAVALTPSIVARAPKALLHDHLDGGLRPQTIVDLAAESGYDGLPTTDAVELGQWFLDSADSGSLVRYLETFSHTVAVMQTREQLVRVARECALDLAADGVVYAESRFAPEQHLAGGLSLEHVVEAVLEGFAQGQAEAAEAGTPIRVVTLLTAMRHAARSREIAELAVRYRDEGVGGFDIAGAEAGFPPTRHLDAACGTGRHAELLARSYEVTGVDLDEGLLEVFLIQVRSRALLLALELAVALPDDAAVLAGAVPDLAPVHAAAVPADNAPGEAAGAGRYPRHWHQYH